MITYILLFAIISFAGIVSFNKPKISKLNFTLICLALGIFVGLGDMLGGYDRYVYAQAFNAQYTLQQNQIALMPFYWKEPGFGLLNMAVAFFTPNRYIFIFIITILIYYLYSISLYRYSRYPLFALFIFMGLMFFFTFTYLRQVLAAGIVWMSIPYVTQRKFWKFFLFILLGTTFHNSAVIFLILYFIPLQKFKIQNIILVMSILFIIGISGITSIIFSIYGDSMSEIASSAGNYELTSQHGFRIEYLLESVVFLTILLINYNKLNDTPENCTYINAYLIFCGTLLFFILSSDGGRLSWYSFIGIFAILPLLCTQNNMRIPILILTTILYLRILLEWNVLLSPYKTFLTNGVREGDFIEEIYEYDQNYQHDKLYNL